MVEEACEQLGYTLQGGHYVKEADIRKQHEKSALAQTLRKFGIDPHSIKTGDQDDTLDQVRVFIRELFPKMPAQDLNEIVRHAWEEGTKRVGNNSNMDLPRRAQLATIARIRHMYTDYDRLLRAFEWKEARSMVEPECLKKLIEWRGETEADDDDELEEIVRETIVLDSDDEDAGRASEADDEDSVTENESGDASEVEITHHTVSHEDIAAESGIDGRSKFILDKFRPKQRDLGLRNAIAKQKIGAVRQQLRTANTRPQYNATQHPAQQHVRPVQVPSPNANGQSTVSELSVQPDQHGRYAQQVVIGGKLYQLVSESQNSQGSNRTYCVQVQPEPKQAAATPYQQAPRPVSGAYGQLSATNAHSPTHPPFSRSLGFPAHEQAVASIERATPERGEKRSRTEATQAAPGTAEYRPLYDNRRVSPREGRLVQVVPRGAEVVDLTSPRRPVNGIGSSPFGHSRPSDARFLPYEHQVPGSAPHNRPVSGYAIPPAAPVPYDPRQAVPYAAQEYIERPAQAYRPMQQYGEPTMYANGQPYPYQRPLQPIHGAPAPVQQVEPPRQYVPADGAVAPTQYYYPR